MSTSSRRSAVALIVTTLAIAGTANATISASDPFIVITATQGSLSGSYVIPLSDPGIFVFNDPAIDLFDWILPGTVNITSGSTVLATVSANTGVAAARAVQPDDSVRWGITGAFNVTAGAADTQFTITFPTLFLNAGVGNASLQASAGLVGTDQPQGSGPNPFDGISTSGNFGAGGAFQAYYNNNVFREYIVGPQGNPGRGQSFDVNGNMSPPGSFESLPGYVYSIGAEYRFTASAFDQVAGSFDITLVPAPGSIALLGLGGMLAARRRR